MRNLLMGLAISVACLLANATPAGQSAETKGIAPRANPASYPVNAQHEGVAIGVKLLTGEEAHKAFVANVNACCLVVEVGLYPQKDKPLEVSYDDFTLRVVGTTTAEGPKTARLVASSIQKRNDSQHDVSVAPTATVGYESGTYIDPVTGQPQRVHGVYTSVGVGVGVDPAGSTSTASDHEQEVVEKEFREKGLLEGSTTVPVTGYLYFSIPKKKKDAKLVLEYVIADERVTLPLP